MISTWRFSIRHMFRIAAMRTPTTVQSGAHVVTKVIGRLVTSLATLAVGSVDSVSAQTVVEFAESEPNHPLILADDTGLRGPGFAVLAAGQIGLGTDNYDDFYFELPEAEFPYLIRATVTPTAEIESFRRISLELRESDESYLLSQRTRDPSAPLAVREYLLSAGRYYVSLFGDTLYSPTGINYTMEIEVSEVSDPGARFDADNDECVPAPVPPFRFEDQFIGNGPTARRDRDCFCADVPGAGVLTAEVNAVGAGLLQPILWAGPPDMLITAYEHLRPDLQSERIEVAIPDGGPVTVCVTGGETDSGTTGFYDLGVDFRPVDVPEIGLDEPNDSISQALPIDVDRPGEATHSGYVGDGRFASFNGDADFYAIAWQLDTRLDVEVTPQVGFVPVVRLYDSLGQPVANWSQNTTGTVRGTHIMCDPDSTEPRIGMEMLFVAVLGVGDRPQRDLFVPSPHVASYSLDQLTSLYAIDGGPGATGAYDIRFGVTPAEASDCGLDPGASVDLVTEIVIEEHGIVSWDRPSDNASADAARLLAFGADTFTEGLWALDSQTGYALNQMPSPESQLPRGLALGENGDAFLLGGSSVYPYLYRIDGQTGELRQRVTTSLGSGIYGDITVFDGAIYIVDRLEDAIFRVPTSLDGTSTRLDIGTAGGISMFGSIASIFWPGRLIVADAADPTVIHYLSADDGSVVASAALAASCECDADFDQNGTIDSHDLTFIDDCVNPDSQASFDCRHGDLNCDGRVTTDDQDIAQCQYAAQFDLPPESCCPPDLPSMGARATGLTATGSDDLIAVDWAVPQLRRFTRLAQLGETVGLDAPLQRLAGATVARFGDGNGDATVDLVDYALLQQCVPHQWADERRNYCAAFDFDSDRSIDGDDFLGFYRKFYKGVHAIRFPDYRDPTR